MEEPIQGSEASKGLCLGVCYIKLVPLLSGRDTVSFAVSARMVDLA